MEKEVTPTPFDDQITRQTRRQIWLQIYVPIGISVLILAGLATWILGARFGTVSAWADVALVMILLPALVLGLLVLVVFAGLTYAVFWVNGRLREPFRKLYTSMEQAGEVMQRGADVVVQPVFGVRKVGAVCRAIGRGLRSLFIKNEDG